MIKFKKSKCYAQNSKEVNFIIPNQVTHIDFFSLHINIYMPEVKDTILVLYNEIYNLGLIIKL